MRKDIVQEPRGYSKSCTIRAFTFQPFASRQGQDTVVGLRFPFNPSVAQILKQCFVRIRHELHDPEHFILAAGGWLPKNRCWFVEQAIWPTVQRELEAAGYALRLEGQRANP